MTKNGKAKWAGIIIMLAVLFAGLVTTWTIYRQDIDKNTESVVKLETDGCKPAIQHKFDIAIMKNDIETIKAIQTEIRVEQQAAFMEILGRLPK